MSAGAVADGEVDHLGGENTRPHHAHERNLVMVELPLRAARNVRHRRRRDGVHRAPHRNAQKPVRYVHRAARTDCFHGSTFVRIVRRFNERSTLP